MTRLGTNLFFLAAAALAVGLAGCVRRSLTIETEPAGALVFLNDEEVGRSPVTTGFTWYGDYDLIVRLDGYETLSTHFVVKRPWYQVPPIDFCAEVLWPGHVVDRRSFHFALAPAETPDRAELVDRAKTFRDRALFEVH
ncbi:MAG: PEGA domain-containing protein [Phycisphaerae bacterium]